MSKEIIFLKLGGSLITDKSSTATVRPKVLENIAAELGEITSMPSSPLILLGHGSGSFGHVPAKKYGTRGGVQTKKEWRGFAEVWAQATALNRVVIDYLIEAGLPAIAFPPSSSTTTRDGKITSWDTAPIQFALKGGLLPVVYGDVVFDYTQGGTIVSTEDVFAFLAKKLNPNRILIAGIEDGVWEDYPACTKIIHTITPANFSETAHALKGSAHTDVTGGMESKVREMLNLVTNNPGLTINIFNGKTPHAIHDAIHDKHIGTQIYA